MQIGQDSSIYKPNIILGRMFDVISHLICIFLELVPIFADVKQRFLVLFFHGVLCDTPEKNTPKKNSRSTHQYSNMFFLANVHYTLHWLSRLVTKSFVFEMSIITGASRRLEPVLKCSLFLWVFKVSFPGPRFPL